MYEHRSKWGSDMVYVAARAYRSKNFARRAEEAIRNVYWDCQSPEPGQREWYILEDIQAKALIEFVTLDEPLDPNLEPFSFLRHGKRKPY
jgi:hypothetical protein